MCVTFIVVSEALKTLSDHKVSGAPVFHQVDPAKPPVYVGFVDAGDLAALVLAKGLKRDRASGVMSAVAHLLAPMEDVDHEVCQAVNRSGRNQFYVVPTDTSNLSTVANIMLSKGVHRVALVDSLAGMAVQGIVTLTSVLKAVEARGACLGRLGSTSVGALFRTGDDAVFALPDSATARFCFQELLANNYYGCALVNDAGALVGSVSLWDVVALADSGLSAEAAELLLDGSIASLLRSAGTSGSATAARGASAPSSLLGCTVVVEPSDTLGTVLQLLCSTGAHRVYVISADDRRPVGVITQVDVLRAVLAPALLIPSSPVAGDTPVDGLPGVGHTAATTDAGVATAASTAPAPTLATMLRSLTASAFLVVAGTPYAEVVDVEETASLAEVLDTLQRHSISAVPVYRLAIAGSAVTLVPRGPSGGVLGAPKTTRSYLGWVGYPEIAAMVLDRGACMRSCSGVYGG